MVVQGGGLLHLIANTHNENFIPTSGNDYCRLGRRRTEPFRLIGTDIMSGNVCIGIYPSGVTVATYVIMVVF